MNTTYLTIESYKEAQHKLFSHEFVKVGETILVIYKNKGYTSRSTLYGDIFEINQKDGNVLKFKTKNQVVKFLSKL